MVRLYALSLSTTGDAHPCAGVQKTVASHTDLTAMAAAAAIRHFPLHLAVSYLEVLVEHVRVFLATHSTRPVC